MIPYNISLHMDHMSGAEFLYRDPNLLSDLMSILSIEFSCSSASFHYVKWSDERKNV